MNTSVEAKNWLRSYARRRRQSVSTIERTRSSRLAVKNLLKSHNFQKAKVLALYVGFGSEVQTDLLIEAAWKARKTVLIPNTSRGLHRPYFQEYKKGDTLKKTQFGPLELTQPKPEFSWKKIDLVVAPGLAFDGKCHRLGYGGGTYDRILAKTRQATHVGLFFSHQKMAYLPSEKHDCKLSVVVTD